MFREMRRKNQELSEEGWHHRQQGIQRTGKGPQGFPRLPHPAARDHQEAGQEDLRQADLQGHGRVHRGAGGRKRGRGPG